ncbi:MAG: DNA polymerase III subunit gamma/tau [Treponema sp.]|nr:DNA polymerase III subunit gamma/tau [Candidatus Treponema caballi]
MAYEVTATLRRPKKFNELVGQEFVTSTLQNSISSGKIAHAYLFSGPRGCGKTSTARILAKVLNCEQGPENAPCGECTACKEISRGTSMDVIEIDGASNTSVNDVRQIKDEILFPPNSCKYKIYIIDEVHMLSTPAFNALLKTIEEPPPYVIFIFATTELHKVPATIKSRCQQFHFRLGSVDQIKELLSKAAAEAGIEADDEALFWIARESTGSFRDAYTLFDQVVSFSDGHITYDKIRDKLGLVGTDRLNELCELCCDGNAGAVFTKLNEYLEAGVSIEQLVSNITDYLRSLLLIQTGITKEALLGQSADRFSKKVLAAWDAVRLERGISLFLALYRDLRYSLSPRFELELALSKLCWLSKYVSSVEVKAAIDAARGLLAEAPAAGPAPALGSAQSAFSAQPANQTAGSFQGSAPTNPRIPNLLEGFTDAPAGSASPEPGSFAPPPEEPRPFPDGGDRLAPVTPVLDAAPSEAAPEMPDMPAFEETPAQAAPADPTLSIDEVRDRIIENLKFSNSLLASALMSTMPWEQNGDNIIIPVDNGFKKSSLQAESHEINAQIKSVWGRALKVVVLIREPEKKPEEILPDGIKNVCKVFNGTILQVTDVKESDDEIVSEQNTIDQPEGE